MLKSLGLDNGEDGYRLLLDTMSHIVWVTDAEGHSLYLNKPGLARLGATPDRTAGWGWLNFLHPDDIPRARDSWLVALSNGRDYRNEYRIRQPDGSYRWYLAKATVMPRSTAAPAVWIGTWTDIDDRHRVEAERDAVLERLRQYIDRMPLAYVLFDAELRISDWNAAAERIFGYRRDDMLGCGPPFEPVVPPSARAAAGDILARVRAGDMAAHSINENMTKRGQRIICEWFNTPQFDRAGAFAGLVSLAQDITARKGIEDELAASNAQLRASAAQLRALSASLSSAREAEGLRIARELHDELGGSLSVIKWEVERLSSSIARGEPLPAAAIQERLAAIAQTVGLTVQSVQRIASELRPSMLDDLGLVDAIEWHTQEFERRTGIAAGCEREGVVLPPFAAAHATAIFRVFQEALTNVMRHARAARVEVRLISGEDMFTLVVRDSGIGITAAGGGGGGGGAV